MASYQYVFTLFNTQGPDRHDHLPKFYSQAHNDWLQALAEYGFVGSSLIALCAIVPLWSIRRSRLSRPIPACLLTGCGALLLYAWVEFPFGNVAVVLSWWLCYFTGTSYARLLPAEDSLSAKSAPIAVANIESSARDA
jgi:O-antigen ligase